MATVEKLVSPSGLTKTRLRPRTCTLHPAGSSSGLERALGSAAEGAPALAALPLPLAAAAAEGAAAAGAADDAAADALVELAAPAEAGADPAPAPRGEERSPRRGALRLSCAGDLALSPCPAARLASLSSRSRASSSSFFRGIGATDAASAAATSSFVVVVGGGAAGAGARVLGAGRAPTVAAGLDVEEAAEAVVLVQAAPAGDLFAEAGGALARAVDSPCVSGRKLQRSRRLTSSVSPSSNWSRRWERGEKITRTQGRESEGTRARCVPPGRA